MDSNIETTQQQPAPQAVASKDGLFRIECTSIMGWPVWVTNVSEPIDTGEGISPIVSMINRPQKANLYTRAEAEEMLPQVKTIHPEARIVAA